MSVNNEKEMALEINNLKNPEFQICYSQVFESSIFKKYSKIF